ncbi:tRNA 2-thiouridine(34) synthase MnmA [bacterium CG2_30_33_46]|nr:MAG: tRNA 2-thiouridine(34) synthase MnmA [bacterium CG2_30_33_46]
MKSKRQKVVVAMSGGVDSSVAAFLLKEQGYDVIGVFMRFWSSDQPKNVPFCAFENLCCSAEAMQVALETANKLKILFHVLDLRDFFKKNIVDYFIDEYLSGRTPNPCIVCGQKIKFSALFHKAIDIFEADYFATGHYARVDSYERLINGKKEKMFRLLKGTDSNKDQSYFLYTAIQKVLKHFLLPIGGYRKEEVRRIAKESNLPSYNRKESQEICFVPFGDYRQFLESQVEPEKFKAGKIINAKGEILGQHNGIAFYTVGQRKGIGIAAKEPLYVIDINSKDNILVVGKEKDLYRKSLLAENINWISGKAPTKVTDIKSKIRYAMKEQKADIHPEKDKFKLTFKTPQRAITSGQSAVFYDGEEVLGGGIIDHVL